jgi:structural maintenance of chromosome 4
MPPKRTTRQSAASTADAEPAPAPALARRTRASLTQSVAAPAYESADELDMDEPVKPVRKSRASAKEKVPAAPKEPKVAVTRKPAASRASTKAAVKEPAAKPKAVGRRKVKEVEPAVESDAEGEDEIDAAVNVGKNGEVSGNGEADAAQPELVEPLIKDAVTDEEEEEELTVRRAPSSAPQATASQLRNSARRPSPAVPITMQTEDDALDALLSQSQHRSVHQRTANQPEIPQTPMPVRTVPQTPVQATARTRFVPGTVQGTAMKARPAFPQTPGGLGRTPGPSQHLGQAQDVKPLAVAPKKRLVIHKLVLVDFKSYAGRQEIGPFHKVRSKNA